MDLNSHKGHTDINPPKNRIEEHTLELEAQYTKTGVK